MRQGEVNDVDYHFVSVEEFLHLKEEDAFVETTFYNGRYYGCSKKECGKDKCIVLDPKGLASFLALGDPSLVSFYLDCDERVREARMRFRGDSEDNIRSRLENDRIDFDLAKMPKPDFIIDSSTKTIEELTDEVHDLYLKTLQNRS